MAAPLNAATVVRDFVESIGTSLDHLPNPFDGELTDAIPAMPARLQGKFAKLRETETEVFRRYVKEQGALRQRAGNSGYFSRRLELDRNEEKDRSAAREQWYLALSADEKAAFDAFCLELVAPALDPLFPKGLDASLRGALARLALEVAALGRRYRAKRKEIETSVGGSLTNPTVRPQVLGRVDEDKKETLSMLLGRWLRELTPEQEKALGGSTQAVPTPDNRAPATKTKRSTQSGEARTKLVSALSAHHKYADGGCLNLEPIGNNELARQARVDRSTASAFFKDRFKGHGAYKVLCRNAAGLGVALRILNDELAPHHLYGKAPPGESEPKD